MARINDLGIDVGTSYINIYMKDRTEGIVLHEPAVVAVDRNAKTLLAVGKDAYEMIGRAPSNVAIVKPLQSGHGVELELTERMLQYFIQKVVGTRIWGKPRAVVSLPSGINPMEEQHIVSKLLDTSLKTVHLLDRDLAVAIGLDLPFREALGSMIVDMGAGMTDIAILSMGDIVTASNISTGGDTFDNAIIGYLRKKYNLLIGERSAEDVKIEIGSCVPRSNNFAMDVTGRNLLTGLPRTQSVTSQEVYEALKEPVSRLIDAIQKVLEHCEPQLVSDVYDDGIILSGGASQLSGLPEVIYNTLHIPCGVAEDPQYCVAFGCGKAVENFSEMQDVLSRRRKAWVK